MFLYITSVDSLWTQWASARGRCCAVFVPKPTASTGILVKYLHKSGAWADQPGINALKDDQICRKEGSAHRLRYPTHSEGLGPRCSPKATIRVIGLIGSSPRTTPGRVDVKNSNYCGTLQTKPINSDRNCVQSFPFEQTHTHLVHVVVLLK